MLTMQPSSVTGSVPVTLSPPPKPMLLPPVRVRPAIVAMPAVTATVGPAPPPSMIVTAAPSWEISVRSKSMETFSA